MGACKKCRAILPRYGAKFERVPEIPYLNGLMAAYVYEDEIEQAVRALKFSYKPGNAETLAMLTAESIRDAS